jgi:hypothetical protein
VPNAVAAEPGPVSPDGSTGVLQVRFDVAAERLPTTSVERVMDLAGEAEGDGLRVELGGYPIERVERQEAGSESVGLLAALVILLVAFDSALAAGGGCPAGSTGCCPASTSRARPWAPSQRRRPPDPRRDPTPSTPGCPSADRDGSPPPAPGARARPAP